MFSLLCVLSVARQRHTNAVKAIYFKEAELITSHMQRNKKRKEKKLECRQIGGLRSIWWSANTHTHVVVCLCVAANCCWINCKSFIIWLVKAKWSYKPFKRVQSIPPKWWRSLFDFVSDDFNSFSHWMMRKFRQIMENHTQNNTIVFCYICVCWLNHWLRSNRLRYFVLLHTHTQYVWMENDMHINTE